MSAVTAREKGIEAQALRDAGLKWDEIAKRLGVPTKSVAWYAHMHGTADARRRYEMAQKEYLRQRRPDAGYRAPNGTRKGEWIAKVLELRASGLTMRQIADTVGVGENVVIGAIHRERKRRERMQTLSHLG